MGEVALVSGLVLAAVALVVVSGANDGGVLLAMGIRHPVVPAGCLVAILAAVLVIGPLLFGTAVATTLTSGLFGGAAIGAPVPFLMGVGTSLAVVQVLTRAGLPTSLTLALVGGLAGAGLGAGIDVSWPTVGRVLLIGALAPMVGALLGFALDHAARLMPAGAVHHPGLRVLHVVAFTAQCGAYSVNDAQKMLAVSTIAVAALPRSPNLLEGATTDLVMVLVATAAVFCIGMLWTLRPVSARIGFDLAQLRPTDAVSAELAGAGAVTASSLLGAPVSMTQSLAAGLVGVAGSKGMRRVRWDTATRIVAAWFITLPSAALAGTILGLAAKIIGVA